MAYIDHTDIPGLNSVFGGKHIHVELNPPVLDEEIFSTGRIHCSGQAIGLIVASTADQARAAAAAVIVTYANEQPPVLNIEDALSNGRTSKKTGNASRNPETAKKGQSKRIEGVYRTFGTTNNPCYTYLLYLLFAFKL